MGYSLFVLCFLKRYIFMNVYFKQWNNVFNAELL